MTTLSLLLLLAFPAAAHDHDKALEYGPISEELAQMKRPSPAALTERLKKASPATKKLVSLFAKHKAQRCGVCDARLDAEGVHCGKAEGLYNNCGQGCGAEILLIPAAELKKAGAADAIPSGDLRALIEYGAFKNGKMRSSFMASPVATCR